MHSGITSLPSACSEPPIHTQRNWSVLFSRHVAMSIEVCLFQGELAHRLVKRLYGLTNKKDAPEQIARRYRRAHHFGTSGSRDPSTEGIPLPDSHRAPRYDGVDDSPEFHHTITNSRNNPVELASFSKMEDPAATVGELTPPVALAF